MRPLLFVLSLACAVLVVLVWIGADGGSRAAAGALEPAADVAASSAHLASEAGTSGARRASTEAGEPPRALDEPFARAREEPAAAVAGLARDVEGRVVDAAGLARGRIAIALEREAKNGLTLATSDAQGAFRIARLELPATLVALDPAWSTVAAATVEAEAEDPARPLAIVVAPAIDVAGLVVDADGTALAGARLVVLVLPEALSALAPSPDPSALRRHLAISDRDGRFRFERLPSIEFARIATRVAGCLPDERELPRESTDELWIELASDRGAIVKGLVEQADGTPAHGATVRLGRETARALADGSFRIVARDLADDAPLEAVAKGRQPARLERFGAEVARHPEGVPPVRLVLGGATLSIEGHVLDAAGAGAKRWLVEAFPDDGSSAPLPRASPQLAASSTTTDKDGRFVIEGLLAQKYRVRASHARSPLPLESEPVEAATRDLLLRVADAPPTAGDRVRGHVLSASGEALAGVRIVATAGAGRDAAPPWTETATSAEDGSFELSRAPRGRVTLELSGAAIVPGAQRLDPAFEGSADEELVLRAAKRISVRFETAAGASELPDAVGFVDAAGRTLPSWAPSPELAPAAQRVALDAGGAVQVTVGDPARTLIAWRGGAELGRRTIPAPDGTGAVTVRWE